MIVNIDNNSEHFTSSRNLETISVQQKKQRKKKIVNVLNFS